MIPKYNQELDYVLNELEFDDLGFVGYKDELKDYSFDCLIVDREKQRAKHRKSRKGQRKAKEKILISGHGMNLITSLCGKKMGYLVGHYRMLTDFDDIKDEKKYKKYTQLSSSSHRYRKRESIKKFRIGEKQIIKRAYMECNYDYLVHLLEKDPYWW